VGRGQRPACPARHCGTALRARPVEHHPAK
jgi:hypothetical protein